MRRIPVEEKHIYSHLDTPLFGNIRTGNIIAPTGTFRWHNPVLPVQGTGQDQRIGRKIRTMNVVVEGYITLDNRSDPNGVPAGGNPGYWYYYNGFYEDFIEDFENTRIPFRNLSLTIPIRHMVVEFKDEDFYEGTDQEKSTYLTEWYKNLVIQTNNVSTDYPSVQQSVLRESTPYTGRFTVLKDVIYWIDNVEKTQVHFNYTLPYNKVVNFEADGSDATNSHLYFLFIGPTNPLFDYRNRAFGTWLTSSVNNVNNADIPPIIADIDVTTKVKYLDF